MRSGYRWALLIAAIVIVGSTVGQEKPKEKETKPAPAAAHPEAFTVEVRFADDSSVKAALQQKSIEVSTRYGKLTVPVDEIRSIEFGLRIPEEAAKKIDAAIARLASQELRSARRRQRSYSSCASWPTRPCNRPPAAPTPRSHAAQGGHQDPHRHRAGREAAPAAVRHGRGP